MFDSLKRLIGGSANPTALPDQLVNDRVDGSSLGDDIDAIRQTQMLDESLLKPQPHVSTPPPTPTRPRRGAKGARTVPPTKQSVPPYTPLLRPPTAVLAAFDDGSTQDAELFRLRGGTHVIGRDKGDVQFPHEVLMSSQHAEIQCRLEGNHYIWHFTDLKSRNGSFFRVGRAPLNPGQEFMLGRHRFLFRIAVPGMPNDHASAMPSGTSPSPSAANPSSTPSAQLDDDDLTKTQMVGGIGQGDALPELVVRGLDGTESIHRMARDHIVIGGDQATCALALPNDPYLSPNHARVFREDGIWKLEDLGSRNATWFRMASARLDQMTEFQLGEQRFYFRPHAPRA